MHFKITSFSQHINSRDASGKTAVILCAFIDNEELGLRLLNILLEDPRTDHDTDDNYCRNIFTYAVIKGSGRMLQLLVDVEYSLQKNLKLFEICEFRAQN